MAHLGGRLPKLTPGLDILLDTVIGAGTLAMPSVLAKMGIMLGITMMIWSGLTSAFGLYLQSRCARYLDRGHSSFFALAQLTFPNAAVIFDAAIAIKCFGVGVSYLIVIGDLMPGVVEGLLGNRMHLVPWFLDRNFWITLFMIVIIPLVFLRRLDSLKYTSIVALVSIGYLIVLVVYHFAGDTVKDKGSIRVFEWAGPVATLSSLPIVIFAFTCHQNMFSILNEISDNSPGNILYLIAGSIGSAGCVYLLVAITDSSSATSIIGKAAIVVLVTFSVPLQFHPCRASLDAVLKWRPTSIHRSGERSPTGRGSLLSSSSSTTTLDSHGSPVIYMSDARFSLLTLLIIGASYTVALYVSSFDRVLAYVGATGSTSISFILPGLLYHQISNPEDVHHQRLLKGDDDAVGILPLSCEELVEDVEQDDVAPNTDLLYSPNVPGANRLASAWRWKRRFRWDFEHVDPATLRRMALGLAVYGIMVMGVCLVLNTFMAVHE